MSTNAFNYQPWVPPFRYHEGGQWIEDSKGQRLLDLRGWGFLTGKNALAMEENAAAQLQDKVGRHVTELLNADTKECRTLTPGGPAEKAKGRSEGYHQMSAEDQWAEDKRLGILDWDGK